MKDKDIQLDAEAEKLFQELHGMVPSKKRGTHCHSLEQLSDSLREKEEELDEKKICLIDLMHFLSSYIVDFKYWEDSRGKKDNFNQFKEIFAKISGFPGHDGIILIRFRGFPTTSNLPEKYDYVVMLGNITVDAGAVPSIIKRVGIKMSHISGRLSRAFEIFSENGINNLHIEIPANDSESFELFMTSLNIIAQYNQAVKMNAPINFEKNSVKKTLLPVFDERNQPDPNLTMAAGLNELKPETMDSLVKKLNNWLQQQESSSSDQQFSSVYNALFGIKTFNEKLIKPPIELNNVKWLMLNRGERTITVEKARVGRMVMESFGDSPQKTAYIMKSMYGNDFEKIGSQDFGDRVKTVTDLIQFAEQNPKGQQILEDVLKSAQKNFDQVRDEVFDDMVVEENFIKIQSSGKESIIDNVNSKLLNILNRYKGRSVTRKKIKKIASPSANFDAKDYETIALDFGISSEDAEDIIKTLQSCFDSSGHFLKSVFEKNIPNFIKYERKIFELLWRYLKDIFHRNDRVAFLNALQLLIDRMKQPKRALRILLEDFYGKPDAVNFADRNALMLANLLIRKYNKEFNLNIELTPEEVLLVQYGLDRDIAKYAAWRIDGNQEDFYLKIKTIRQEIAQAILAEDSIEESKPFKYLLSLEREVNIFLSLIEGETALSVIKSAVQQYGDPDSGLYSLPDSSKYFGMFLHHLRVAVKALGRVGGKEELELLGKIRDSEKAFLAFGQGSLHKELVIRVMDAIDSSRKNILQKG